MVVAALICFLVAMGLRRDFIRREAIKEYERTHFDAGQVFSDLTPYLAHRFTITNRSGRHIKLVEKSCTCTCTTSRLEPESLEPGASASLDMSIRVEGAYSGKSTIRCDLRFDDGSDRTCQLTYESFPRIMADLTSLDLGTFGPDPDPDPETTDANSHAAVQTRVSLFAPEGQPVPELRSIRAPDEVRASIEGEPLTTTMGTARCRQYMVRFEADPRLMAIQPHEAVSRTVDLLSSDGASTFVTLTWRKPALYSVTPSPVSFGTIRPGDPPQTRRVLIKTAFGRSFQILSARSSSDLLKAECSDTPVASDSSTAQCLDLRLTPPRIPARDAGLAGEVTVKLADEHASSLIIPWSAIMGSRTVDQVDQQKAPVGAGTDGLQ